MDDGRAALRRTIHGEYDRQRGADFLTKLNAAGLGVGLGLLMGAVTGAPKLVPIISVPLLGYFGWLIGARYVNEAYRWLPRLRDFSRSALFDRGIWLDLVDDDGAEELRVGLLEIALLSYDFEARLKQLFARYIDHCTRNEAEPYPANYAQAIMWQGLPRRIWRNYALIFMWRYALAQVLDAEFFGTVVVDGPPEQRASAAAERGS